MVVVAAVSTTVVSSLLHPANTTSASARERDRCRMRESSARLLVARRQPRAVIAATKGGLPAPSTSRLRSCRSERVLLLHRTAQEKETMAMKKKPQVDAIALLKADHKKVRVLLETLDQTDAPARRTKLVGQIELELKVHTQIEEEIFYPAFRRRAEDSEQKQMFLEAKEEHGLVDIMLPKVKKTNPSSDEFAARAKVLKDLVLHHKKEEEKEMFKAAKELFDKDELKTLGDQMQRRKRELTREMKR
jgi:hemerythrin superfamily protein